MNTRVTNSFMAMVMMMVVAVTKTAGTRIS